MTLRFGMNSTKSMLSIKLASKYSYFIIFKLFENFYLVF